MRELEYPFNSELIMRKRRGLLRQLKAQDRPFIDKRVAVLNGATADDTAAVLELFLLNEGILPSFYLSEYNRWWEDSVFSNPELDAFQPEIVILFTGTANIQHFPSLNDSAANVDTLLEAEYTRFENAWNGLRNRYHCVIIQNNFELPYIRTLGNADGTDIHGKVSFVNRLNQKFAEAAAASDDLLINDIHYLSACYGLDKWSDPSYRYLYKMLCCPEAVPDLAYSFFRVIKSLCGKNKKMLVTDLDDTMWGGIIGESGVSGIVLGKETAEGERFSEYQQYLKDLSAQGVMLGIASKNDLENALSGLRHRDCLLKAEDFLDIKADWNPKVGNLEAIAKEMNILPEALVFVDDNPVERDCVRTWLPGTAVPEVSEERPFHVTLDRAGYFEVTKLSADDLKRNEMYRSNARREETQVSFADYDEYLRSLNMKAEILPFDKESAARITQLINKTNQFNLTTRRYTRAEVDSLIGDPEHVTLYGRLTDKFGDDGIVALIIGTVHGSELEIDLWLMSCRVLKRGMEYAMFDALVDAACAAGCVSLRGKYIPSAKNAMVKDLYPELGFTRDGDAWTLELNAVLPRLNCLIEVKQ